MAGKQTTKWRRLRVFGLLSLMAVLATLVPSSPAESSTPVGVYQITVAGTASGNPFVQGGYFTLHNNMTRVTNNGVNPYETCIIVGSPATNPRVGAIRYGTNSGCFGDRKLIDMVGTSVTGDSRQHDYITVPDRRYQALFINSWTARGGITACIYSPVSGSTRYQITNNRVSGTIDLQGPRRMVQFQYVSSQLQRRASGLIDGRRRRRDRAPARTGRGHRRAQLPERRRAFPMSSRATIGTARPAAAADSSPLRRIRPGSSPGFHPRPGSSRRRASSTQAARPKRARMPGGDEPAWSRSAWNRLAASATWPASSSRVATASMPSQIPIS